jgi:hypothetical protein
MMAVTSVYQDGNRPLRKENEMTKQDRRVVAELARMIGMSADFVIDWFQRNRIARSDFSYAVATRSAHEIAGIVLNNKALSA